MANKWVISGKSFLITGGASGLGALYAEAFLKEGAKKIAIADINEIAGKETTNRLNSEYPDRVFFIKCDVGTEEDVEATFNKVIEEVGQLDFLINNAGIMSDAPNIWRKASDVNWQGLVSFTLKALKHMRKDEGGAGGCIVNISSIVGVVTFNYLPIYSGSKAAVLHFSQSLAEHPFYEETGVRIITLLFGATDTPLLQGLKNRVYDEKYGEILEKTTEEVRKIQDFQKPESAVIAMLKALKEGANGSAWFSAADQPAVDISPDLKEIHEKYLKLGSGAAPPLK